MLTTNLLFAPYRIELILGGGRRGEVSAELDTVQRRRGAPAAA